VAQLNVSLQTSFTNVEDALATTSTNFTSELQLEVSGRVQALAEASTTLQNSIDSLGTTSNADLSNEAASREASDSRLENILSCRPGFIRDPNDSTKCITCRENQFWSARVGGCSDCPAHSTATPGSTSCTCDSGFAETTDGQCEDVDECQDATACSDNAECTNTEGSFTCQSTASINDMEGNFYALTSTSTGQGHEVHGVTLDEVGDVFFTARSVSEYSRLYKYHVSDGTTTLVAEATAVVGAGWTFVAALPSSANSDVVVFETGVGSPVGRLLRITPVNGPACPG